MLEHRGAVALFCADAVPTVLLPALRALAQQRRIALPWHIDLLKLSHHGSRANTTQELMQIARAADTVVSTNGAIFGHPDPEGIARVVLHCRPQSRVWFDYRTPRTEVWSAPDLEQRYGFEACFPARADEGCVIQVPARDQPDARADAPSHLGRSARSMSRPGAST